MNPILNNLKTENNSAFGKLYQDNFQKILKFVSNNSGGKADAEDLFQDAMMVLIEKLRNDNFKLTASINTYVYAICKNLWLKKLRDKDFDLSMDTMNSLDFQSSINDSIEEEMSDCEKLNSYREKISKHCDGLIEDIFVNGKAIEEIQKEYGYSTKHSAHNQTYKCVEQIRRVKEQEEKLKKN
ncbi:RNA polymerase sigma factor (sigma-70 family) [Balneicella halophila]|uniref:RNA polymerase sigma factor (Sigma-70 family) n=1 Tax=Balneicella halophila TaxID=1537566 RepID=A0A7L4URQ9_BALHA|nr:sigma-70 family RNA polymerase sigma factor [Balneicella halophila]PVX52440.1 RNA polymerase sigma factor (sigma-70 family) [Balneicella halophila]